MAMAGRAAHSNVAFTFSHCGHHFAEVDIGPAAKLEALGDFGLRAGVEVY
jgi:hypothetical protein